MNACWQVVFCFLVSVVPIEDAERKSLIELAPTAGELGEGWKTGRISCLIDPLAYPSALGPEDLFLVVVEGWASDDAKILRLAKAIEVKLLGKESPQGPQDDIQTKRAEPSQRIR